MLLKNGQEITIGCDPEFFLFNKERKRNESAHKLIPGDKKNPYKVDGGAIQVDGTAVEFNIDAAKTSDEFATNVQSVLGYLRKTIPDKFEFEFTPAIHYNKKYFENLPEFTKELGCDPDFNAYTGAVNPKPPADKVGTMRTGSGHIHIGWTKDADITDPHHIWDCQMVVKNLDAYFSYFSHFWDNDKERTKLYGAAGAYRPKSYGVEYRVLSNAWLKYPEIHKWLFDSCVFIMQNLSDGHSNEHSHMRKPGLITAYQLAGKSKKLFFEGVARYSPFYKGPRMPVIESWTPAFNPELYSGLESKRAYF